MEGHVSPELLAGVVFALLILGYSLFVSGLQRLLITAPLVFVVIGWIIGSALEPLGEAGGAEAVLGLAEITLVLILFHDAASVKPREVEGDRGTIARLLLIGFPVTVLLGWLAAQVVFPGLPVVMALLLAAALAPTDAGLGAPTILNPVVPQRVRRLLNVESGLNDGLATPVVLFAVAVIAGAEGITARESLVDAVVDLAIGLAAGVVVGAGGGMLLGWSTRSLMSSQGSRALAVLMLPLLAYGSASLFGGNGFVAAFVAGTSFAGASHWVMGREDPLELTEQLAKPLGYGVWLVFGISAAPVVANQVGWRELVYALLALTVLRMLPVALSLLRSGFRVQSVLFIGWFGPRGLASIVFALIALESLEADADLERVLATIMVTVLLSIIAHGFSAEPLARRYGAWVDREQPPAELQSSTEPRCRDQRLWQVDA